MSTKKKTNERRMLSQHAGMESLEDRRLMTGAAYNFDHSDAQGSQPAWMSRIPDDRRLSHISIPGTHDTMAVHGGNLAKTQSMGLKAQLDSGIRSLDIRLRLLEDSQSDRPTIGACENADNSECSFYLYHGPIYQHAEFEADVMDVLVSHLTEHPSETIFMRTKQEGASNDFFGQALSEVLDQYADFFVTTDPANTRLGDARGKIALIDDWEGDSEHSFMSFDDMEFGDNEGFWSVNTPDEFYERWDNAKSHMVNASRDLSNAYYHTGVSVNSGRGPWFTASGQIGPENDRDLITTGIRGNEDKWPDFPRRDCGPFLCTIFYEGNNSLAMKTLNTNVREGFDIITRVGVLESDFPGQGLIEAVINTNVDANGNHLLFGQTSESIIQVPPRARLSQSLYEGASTLPITFDAGPSSDGNGDPIGYDWTLVNAPESCERQSHHQAGDAYRAGFNQFLTDNFEEHLGNTQFARQQFHDSERGGELLDAWNREQAQAVFVCSEAGSFQVQVTARDASDLRTFAIADVVIEAAPLGNVGVIDARLPDGPVRIGSDDVAATVVVTNQGGGALQGSVAPSSGVFQGEGGDFTITGQRDTAFSFAFVPDTPGVFTQDITVDFENGSGDGTNQPFSVTKTIRGEAVGPVFDSTHQEHVNNPSNPIDFGTLPLGQTSQVNVFITNASDGLPLHQSPQVRFDERTSLTISAVDFSADSPFRLTGNQTQVLFPTVAPGGWTVELDTTGLPPGTVLNETLTIRTDVNAAAGDLDAPNARTFTFHLTGTVEGCAPNFLIGDFDGNNRVDFSDFLTLSANFGEQVDSYRDGDANCDGTVGFDDFLQLSSNFGSSFQVIDAPGSPAESAAAAFSYPDDDSEVDNGGISINAVRKPVISAVQARVTDEVFSAQTVEEDDSNDNSDLFDTILPSDLAVAV